MESDVDLGLEQSISRVDLEDLQVHAKSAKDLGGTFSSLPVLWPEGLEHGGGRGSEVGAVLRKDLVVVRTAAGSRGAHPARTHPPPPRLGELLDRLRKFSVLEAIMNRVDVQYLARSRNSR